MSDELLFHSKPQSGYPFPTYNIKLLVGYNAKPYDHFAID
ncbi:hypothetical protein VC87395_001067 [Vibrio paracholerae 87395]|nr:hypothetical protein VCHE09_1659 [Vibrio paracholerae HE-09]EMP93438.1 hypothetical protein VC87395_001067 [Vibrio paracholerae 87395]